MSSVPGRATRTKWVALVALCAGLYGAISIQPFKIPAVAAGGTKINPEAVLGPVFGIILGPWLGVAATFLGVLVAIVIPSPFGGGGVSPWTFILIPSPVLGSLISGVLSHRVSRGPMDRAKWIIPLGVFGLLLVAWYLSPVGSDMYYYVAPHFVALGVALLLSFVLKGMLSLSPSRLLTALTAVVFCGTMIDHLWGSVMFAYNGGWLFGLTREALIGAFAAVSVVSVVERIVITILGVLLSVALVAALRRTRLLQQD